MSKFYPYDSGSSLDVGSGPRWNFSTTWQERVRNLLKAIDRPASYLAIVAVVVVIIIVPIMVKYGVDFYCDFAGRVC